MLTEGVAARPRRSVVCFAWGNTVNAREGIDQSLLGVIQQVRDSVQQIDK
jgi:hypothetical protein